MQSYMEVFRSKQKNIMQFSVALFIIFSVFTGNAFGETQTLTLEPATTSVALGSNVSIIVTHSTSNDCRSLTGVSIKVYFNPDLLTYTGYSNVFAVGSPSVVSADGITDDTTDGDSDPTTTKIISGVWTDTTNYAWPGSTATNPLNLCTLNFTANATQPGTANVNVRMISPSEDWCTDSANGPAYTPVYNNSVVTIPDPAAPTVSAVTANGVAVTAGDTIDWKVNTPLPVVATISDTATGNSNITAAAYTTDGLAPGETTTTTMTGDGTVDAERDFSVTIPETAFPTAPGTVIVNVAGKDTDNWSTPFTFTVNVIASEVSASASTFTMAPAGPLVADGTVANTYTFTVTALKTGGTIPVAGVPVTLSVDGDNTGLTLTQPVAFTDANGVATGGTLTSTKAGEFTVRATAEGVPLTTPKTAVFTADVPAKIKLDVTKRTISTNGTDSVTAPAVIEDANGNPVTNYSGDVIFTLSDATYAAFTGPSATATVTVTNGSPASITATMTSTGTLVGTNSGAFTLTASSGTLAVYDAQNTANPTIPITAQDKALDTITVSGNATPDLCADVQYTAEGTFDDTSKEDVTAAVTWSVTNGTGTGTIVPTSGLFTPGTAGTVTIKAEDPANAAVSDTHAVTIGPAPAMAVGILSPTMPIGGTLAFGAAVTGGCPAAAPAPPYAYSIAEEPTGCATPSLIDTTTGVFTANCAGTYKLRAADNKGTAPAEHTVTVNCDVDITAFTATSQTTGDSSATSGSLTVINGDTVDFTAIVTGTVKLPDGWLWTFGDTATDTTENTANHRYLYDEATTPLPVTVNATLTVTSAHTSGCTDTSITIPVTIQPCDAVADFTASTRVITVNDATGVTFTNAVTPPPADVNYAWTFGNDSDPVSSTDPSPASVKYTTPGVKTVVLTATGATGCFNTKTMLIYVNDLVATCPLLPGFNTVPATGIIVGEEVTFTDSTTGTPTAAPTTVSWDTNDDGNFELAGTGTPAVGTKTFTEQVENLTVIQKVVDGACIYYAAGEPISVTCDAANAAITTDPSPATVVSGGTVTFTGSGSPATVNKYTWWLGTDTTVAPFCDGLATGSDGCLTITPPPFTTNATITMRAYGTNNCAAVPDATVAVTVACDVTTASVTPATVALPCTGAFAQTFTASSNLLGAGVYKWWLGVNPDTDTTAIPNYTGFAYTPANVTAPTIIYMRAYNATETCYVQKTATVTAAVNCGGGVVVDPGTGTSVNAPTANFVVEGDKLTGTAPFTVKFKSTSAGGGIPLPGFPGAIVSYEWDFGDGTKSTDPNPEHTYNTPGEYTVTLKVTTDQGISHTESKVNYVKVTGCTAVFAATETNNPLEVKFDASASGGTGLVCTWNLGDGTTGDGTVVTHTYAQAGTYDVTLTVTGSDGCTHTVTQSVAVTICTAKAQFTASDSGRLTASFNTAGSSGDLVFDYGDETTGTETTHTYAEAGTYTVTLTATASTETGVCSRQAKADVTVTDCDAASVFTVSGVNGMTATFDTTGSVGETLVFDYGDEKTGTEVSHTYAKAGTYTVTLTATSECGSKQSSHTVIIDEPPVTCDVTAVFAVSGAEDNLLTVNFDAAGSKGETFAWDFGDGTTGTGMQASHTYTQGGEYTAVLTVSEGEDCEKTESVKIFLADVYSPECPSAVIAKFASVPETGTAPLAVSFNADGSSDGTYAWDFGDGKTGTGKAAAHTYTAVGDYTASLTVTVSSTGCPTIKATLYKTISVITISEDRPETPVLTEPRNGMTNVALQAVLKSGAFKSPVNAGHKQTLWQIAGDAGFTKPVFSLTSSDSLTSLTVPEAILNPSSTYYWRVRYMDTNGLSSDWSETFSLVTGVNQEDKNGDGVPDNQEVTNPPLALVNGLWVKVLTGEGFIGLEGAENVDNIEWFKWIDARTAAGLPGIKFPWGMCTWKLKVKDSSKPVKVKVHFSKALPEEALWYNYNTQKGWLDLTDHVVFAADMKSVTLTFTDGGAEDDDGVKNGWIVDPAGFGVLETGTVITETECCEDKSDGGSCFIETAASGKVVAGLFLSLIAGLSLIGFRKSQK